jgi:DNA-binding CsgD family transcriptional regulator
VARGAVSGESKGMTRGGRFVLAGREYRYVSYEHQRFVRPPALTDAEVEVARLVMRGASTADIARGRGVSTRTIANQLASIYRKLGVGSRAELVFSLGAKH